MRDVTAWPLDDQLRYHAARFAFRHRWEHCPHSIAREDGSREEITWARWFELRFGMSLDEYQSQLTENRPCT